MGRTTSCLRVLFIVAFCLVLVAPTAHAAKIEFTIAPVFGSVSFAGGTAPLTGTNLRISKVTGIDTPLNSGVELTCLLCELDFTTGAYLGDPLFVSLWSAVGSSLTITGGLNLVPGLPFEIPLGSTLLSGEFESSVFDVHLGALNLVAAMTSGQNHSLLNAFFGLPSDFGPNDFLLLFTAEGTLPDPIRSSAILGGRITNVPEPAVLWFLVVAVFGIPCVAVRARAAREID